MKYKSKDNRTKRSLIFGIIAVVFCVGIVVLGGKLPKSIATLKETKQVLAQTKVEKETKQETVDTLNQNIKESEAKIVALKKELEMAHANYPELYKMLQNKEIKHAYLTFDDGPSTNTAKILDFLKANNIKATFFVIGTEGNDALYKRIVDEGHTLAVHSNTHKYNEIYTSVWAFMNDINTLGDKLESITGERPTILRFPGGSNNTISAHYNKGIMDKLVTEVVKQGYSYFDWNVDSYDASARVQSKDIIVNAVLRDSKNKKNAIILMHDAALKTTTVEALPEIVSGLRKEGFIFDRITEDTVPIQF